MESAKQGQLRLLLWKDFIIRKRKFVTICAAIWACVVVMPFVIVRHNIETEDVPTCSFPARALPSAGMMTFLQSFICTVNNECQPMSSYEIPRYETSKLHSLSQQVQPVLSNETIMELASMMPNAIKLVSTLARVIDEPDIHEFAKNGIRVKDLFVDELRAKKIFKKSLMEHDEVLDNFMKMDIDLMAIMNVATSKSSKNKCNVEILSKVLKADGQSDSLQVMADKLCNMVGDQRKDLLFKLAPEINYKKYFTMIGSVIKNLNGDNWLLQLGEMISASFRLLNLDHYMPEGVHIKQILGQMGASVMPFQESNFTYFDADLLNKFINLFEPTFGDTKVFHQLQGMTQMLTKILIWTSNIISKTSSNPGSGEHTINSVNGALDLLSSGVKIMRSDPGDIKDDFNKLHHAIWKFFENLKGSLDGMNVSRHDSFHFITQAANGLVEILPPSNQHQVLFYSTLLAKLADSARVTVHNNLYIEQLMYNATSRHREVIPIITGLPPSVINCMFDGLADDDRIQILTSKIYYPRQLFCDMGRLQSFLKMDKKTVEQVKHQLCSKPWINYINDLIRQFGIMDIRTTINDIASLVVTETLGKNNSDRLYTISKTMGLFENFINSVTKDVTKKVSMHVDWPMLLNVSTESPLLQVFKMKASMSDEIIIAVHLALAREVIKQNPILESQIVATLTYGGILVESLAVELDRILPTLTEDVRRRYVDMVRALLATGLEEEKIYKMLSSDGAYIFCRNNATSSIDEYLTIPAGINGEDVVQSLCKLSKHFESTLDGESKLGRTILKIKHQSETTIPEDINWSEIIESFQHLYIVLNNKLGYRNLTQWEAVADLKNETKTLEEKWSQKGSLGNTVRLSIGIFLKGMDILDSPIFNMTSSVPAWKSMKQQVATMVNLLNAADYFVQIVIAGYNLNNSTIVRDKLPLTVSATRDILSNFPALVRDGADIFVSEDINVIKISSVLQSASWPCNSAVNSLSTVLPFGTRSLHAVRGIETLFCIGKDLQAEWRDVASINKLQSSNTTSNETTAEHTFLSASRELNSIIKDMMSLETVIIESMSHSDISNDTSLRQDTLIDAWQYAIGLIVDKNQDNRVVRTFATRLDTILSSLTLNETYETSTAGKLWEGVSACMKEKEISDECRQRLKASWFSTLKFVAIAGQEMVSNLIQYFEEINEHNASTLQELGFTKKTSLYMLFDKLPDIAGVLLNSYLDQGFMNQIRKATKYNFWDCEAVVDNMVIPLGSRVQPRDLQRIKPYLCPSLLFWVSIPPEQNTLFDLFASTQNLFYNTPVSTFKPNVSNLFTDSIKLHQLITTSKNVTISDQLQGLDFKSKFNEIVDLLLNWNVTSNNSIYNMFIETNMQQSSTFIYLSQISLAMNHISESISKLNGTVMSIEDFSANTDVKNILKLFKRRPSDFLEIMYNIFTDAMRSNLTIITSMDKMCDNVKRNKTAGNFLSVNSKMALQLCNINYQSLLVNIKGLETPGNEIFYPELAFKNFVATLKNMNVSFDATGFNRTHLQAILTYSIKFAGDLSLPVYLQYLDSVLQHYSVVLSFVSGENWWSDLRKLYSGPYANIFFEALEKSIDIVENLVSHMDKIKLVRLMKDINVNNSDALCSNIFLSNYIPDSTGMLTRLKDTLCSLNQTELFREIPPLTFASQGYESALKLPRMVNESLIQEHIKILQEKMTNFLSSKDRPKPRPPFWIDRAQVNRLKTILKSLSLKEIQVDIGFGVTANLIDALTFFGSSPTDSDCQICSKLTTWVKQVNLQLFKKDEYEALLCHMERMDLNDVYTVLKNNLHWDMALREVTSKRNYTPIELNKSINQLLETSSNQLRHSTLANTSKLNSCVVNQSMDPAVGNTVLSNLTFYLALSAKLLRMVEAVIPHIHEMEGVNETTLLRTLYVDVAHRLPVYVDLSNILTNSSTLMDEMRLRLGSEDDVLKCMQVDISKVSKIGKDSLMLPAQYMSIEYCNSSWIIICSRVNCSQFSKLLLHSINYVWISSNLDHLRNATFWSLEFVSKPLASTSRVLQYVRELLETIAQVDLEGVAAGRVEPVLDFLVQVVQRSTLTQLVSSLRGLLHELEPLLSDTDFEADLRALSGGLLAIEHIIDYLMGSNALKIEISKLFTNHYGIEMELYKIGINNTNFWSMAAEKINAGHIDLKNILKSSDETVHIRSYVCDSSKLWTVLIPTQLGGVTADDVLGAVSEQFCPLNNEQVIGVTTTLFDNINFTYIGNNIMDSVLMLLYSASSLSAAEGQNVMSSYSQMLSVLPSIEAVMKNMSQEFKHEPLFAAFNASNSVGDLLGTPHLLTHVGNMLCGKAIPVDENRLYKIIAETEDFSTDPNPRQLESLPTEFCRDLYRDILRMNGGKIVWTFVKPLIMGKILYTPENNITRTIMKEVNTTFANMNNLRQLVFDMSDMFVHLETMSLHQHSLHTMQLLMESSSFQRLVAQFTGADVGSGSARGLSMEDVVENLDDIRSLGPLVEKLSDLLACINFNRIHPVKDEHSLEVTAGQLTLVNEFSAGIVFLNMNHTDISSPINMEYKIRMDIDNVPTTTVLRNRFFPPGPRSNFMDELRYFRGFIQVQDMVDQAIIEVISSAPEAHEVNERSRRDITSLALGDEQSYANESWAVYTQQMPYPCYKLDTFQTTMYESQALLVGFFFALILTVSAAVRFIVWEKESGNTMLMSVMGLRSASHTLSWFLSSLVEMTLAMTLMLLMLKVGHVLPYSDPFLLWLILINFGFSIVTYCYMISKLFFSASFGSVCASIIYLLSYMPFTIVLSLEIQLSLASKILTALSMSTSFSYILMNVGRYEVMGEGMQWHNMGRSPVEGEPFSILHASLLIMFDSVLYAVVGWIVGVVIDKRHTTSSINYQNTDRVNTDVENNSSKVGVRVSQVSMVYKERAQRDKRALDNVSIDLYSGEITTLLGHNGAGKTTLIKILTGMLKPTSGTVSIPLQVDHQGQTSTMNIGVCAQNDVLLDSLTTEEHLYFYARLKTGLGVEDVREEVESMLRVLDFGSSSQEPVHRLSGGMRRRLCVSVAFVASPQLVILDEPSSGVDPLARRDIWSLIVRLKEDRTVLLTTHHLDEAELLSDRVIIMHRGQIYTSGSPVALKNNFGSGYKLRVTYSSAKFALTDTLNQECKKQDSVEESAKDLVAAVRTVVKNGTLDDVNGKVVEIELPFLSDDGIGNDFLSLTRHLEQQQNKLGFTTFSMDCSSLEQVFFKICDKADGKGGHSAETGLRDSSRSVSTSSSVDKSVTPPPPYKPDNEPLVRPSDPLHGSFLAQLLALLRKRLIHYSHNFWLLCILLVLPALFVGVALVFARLRPPVEPSGVLVLEPGIYTAGGTEFAVFPTTIDPYGPVSFGDSVMRNIITGATRRRHKQVYEEIEDEFPSCKCEDGRQRCSDVSSNNSAFLNDQFILLADNNLLQDWITSTNDLYITKRYGGWSLDSTQPPATNETTLIVWYDNTGHHSLPAFLNSVSNAVLQSRTGREGVNITTYSHPMRISSEPLSRSTVLQHLADLGVAAIILVGFSLIPAANTIYLVSERVTEQKRLQLLCRVTPLTYWLATFIWDMLIIVINVVVTICLLMTFGMEAYTDRENLYTIALVLILFGFSCNSLSHVLEKLFTDASMCNLVLFCSNVCLCCSGLTILFIIDILSTSETSLNIRWYLHKIFLLSPQFAMADAIVEIAKNSIQAAVLSRFGMDTYQSPLSSSLLLYHFVELVVVGLGLFVLNVAIENRWLDFVANWRRSNSALPMDTECEELEVATERYRVELSALRARTELPMLRPKAIQTLGVINAGFLDEENKAASLKRGKIPEGDDDILQSISLRKEYSGVHEARVAVQSLTFGVKPGQCFGLLGVNGAGKSSTFRMLTGQLRPTSGEILLAGQAMDPSTLCRGNISYCPQSDALDPLLTTRQQLQFYCQLRGITNSKEVIRATLEQLDLVKYEKQLVRALSGGNKRKLCTAISLMGKSAIVLLDEPTSGMDPAARRATARAIRAACASRRGVLLTTHSLAETEALCTRVAVLADGAVRALGSPAVLKDRFGGGYLVSMRLTSSRRLAELVEAARRQFPQSVLQCAQYCTAQLLVPVYKPGIKTSVTTKLSDIFGGLVFLNSRFNIEDYTVNESSLDQMFVNFINLQMGKKSVLQPDEAQVDKDEECTAVTAL